MNDKTKENQITIIAQVNPTSPLLVLNSLHADVAITHTDRETILIQSNHPNNWSVESGVVKQVGMSISGYEMSNFDSAISSDATMDQLAIEVPTGYRGGLNILADFGRVVVDTWAAGKVVVTTRHAGITFDELQDPAMLSFESTGTGFIDIKKSCPIEELVDSQGSFTAEKTITLEQRAAQANLRSDRKFGPLLYAFENLADALQTALDAQGTLKALEQAPERRDEPIRSLIGLLRPALASMEEELKPINVERAKQQGRFEAAELSAIASSTSKKHEIKPILATLKYLHRNLPAEKDRGAALWNEAFERTGISF